jgi:5-methylcytosine-specific restriction endonuclease McrA
MQKHTELYLKTFGYDINDFIPCEVCGKKSTDIHHVECRGMGGTKKAEDIINLMALCRECHIEYGDKKQHKEMLKTVHLANLSRLI